MSSNSGEWGHFIALTPTKESLLEQRMRSPMPSPVLRPLRRKTACLYNLSALDEHQIPKSKPLKLQPLQAAIFPSTLCPRNEPQEIIQPEVLEKIGILKVVPMQWWKTNYEVRVKLLYGRLSWIQVNKSFEVNGMMQSLQLTPTTECQMMDAACTFQLTQGTDSIVFKCPSKVACKTWKTILTKAIAREVKLASQRKSSDQTPPIRILPSMRCR
ncbi:hypothetical protein THRCLA_02199 [Thraustotheca clavata]|uniref:PH domain-containing protein n=1 Tax=Thraustotheca clavata TaxID=74557 RepID=A0A1W0A674_9STRA|nr:hypothetical protein THRCLA_02199 [Thraustotheca clavata]